MTEPLLEVHDDADALATAAAGAFLTRLVDLQSSGRHVHVALTGGSIAERFHRAVARHAAATDAPGDVRVDWSRVDFWWGDERFVAPDSEDRNDRQPRAELLDVVGVPADHVHPMPSTAEAGSVDEAARQYAEELRALPDGFDLVLLGVGPDAHVASLMPGLPALDVESSPTVGVTGSPKPPPERVSLTFPALNRARSVWFLVCGDGKADAVAAALAGVAGFPGPRPDRRDVPASAVSGRDETIWFLDRAAAARL